MQHHTDGTVPYGGASRMQHHTDGTVPYGGAFRMQHHAGLPVWELPCDFGKDLPKFFQYSVLGWSSHMGTRLGWRELNWSAAQLGLGWSSHMGTRGQLSVGSLTLPTENRGQLSVGSLTLPTENRGQLP